MRYHVQHLRGLGDDEGGSHYVGVSYNEDGVRAAYNEDIGGFQNNLISEPKQSFDWIQEVAWAEAGRTDQWIQRIPNPPTYREWYSTLTPQQLATDEQWTPYSYLTIFYTPGPAKAKTGLEKFFTNMPVYMAIAFGVAAASGALNAYTAGAEVGAGAGVELAAGELYTIPADVAAGYETAYGAMSTGAAAPAAGTSLISQIAQQAQSAAMKQATSAGVSTLFKKLLAPSQTPSNVRATAPVSYPGYQPGNDTSFFSDPNSGNASYLTRGADGNTLLLLGLGAGLFLLAAPLAFNRSRQRK